MRETPDTELWKFTWNLPQNCMDKTWPKGCGVYSHLLTTDCLWLTALHGKEGWSRLTACFTGGSGGPQGTWYVQAM